MLQVGGIRSDRCGRKNIAENTTAAPGTKEVCTRCRVGSLASRHLNPRPPQPAIGPTLQILVEDNTRDRKQEHWQCCNDQRRRCHADRNVLLVMVDFALMLLLAAHTAPAERLATCAAHHVGAATVFLDRNLAVWARLGVPALPHACSNLAGFRLAPAPKELAARYPRMGIRVVVTEWLVARHALHVWCCRRAERE